MQVWPRSNRTERYNRHLSQRATERYGLTLSTKMVKEIIALVQTRLDIHERDKEHRLICTVCYNDLPMRVVYDKRTRRLVTFLPLVDAH